jgi:hypothetical protein
VQTDDDSKKINEHLIKSNPNLGLINERVVYDKEFLLEVSMAGYDALDPRDVENYVAGLPAKNENRNIIISGAYEGQNLGQGDYDELEVTKVAKKMGLEINLKKTTDIGLTDLPNRHRQVLLEKQEEIDLDKVGWRDVELTKEDTYEFDQHKHLSQQDSRDIFQKNIAKVFGSETDFKAKPQTGNQLVQVSSSVEQTLQLIKELKSLGFSDEEIKQEIKIRR